MECRAADRAQESISNSLVQTPSDSHFFMKASLYVQRELDVCRGLSLHQTGYHHRERNLEKEGRWKFLAHIARRGAQARGLAHNYRPPAH